LTTTQSVVQIEAHEDIDTVSARTILERAYDHAGGASWLRPKSLVMKGHGIFYKDGVSSKHERHEMYRVFEETKDAAHIANGKVRIESYRDGHPIILVTYDGSNTYDLNGMREPSEADRQWSSNFGFGVIRHALDPGYEVHKMPDDYVDGSPAYLINVIDPTGGETLFGIRQRDYAIVSVAFDTPRGWHKRIYSDFFKKTEYHWLQSGRVRLFYNGVKSNEIIWTDYDINQVLDDSLFVL